MQVTGASDEDLVRALRAGSTDSLGTLVARWERPLFRFVHRMLPREEDVRDVCQETFLKVLEKAHRFRDGSRFSTWMYQIALNLCRDRVRKARRWRLVVSDGVDLPERAAVQHPAPSGTDPARTVEHAERAAALRRALETLPHEQREVVVLKEFEGLKFREIAEILGCPESTVKSRMYYGLSGVREALVASGITEP
jgi:RNA polymerase sigma-70 factor (ECF subfamily)